MNNISVNADASTYRLTNYQRDLLNMLCKMPLGYLSDVMPKKPSSDIQAVVAIYNKLVNSKGL